MTIEMTKLKEKLEAKVEELELQYNACNDCFERVIILNKQLGIIMAIRTLLETVLEDL